MERVRLPPSHRYFSLESLREKTQVGKGTGEEDKKQVQMQLAWDLLPPSIDPGVDFTRDARYSARRERKMRQAESFAVALRRLLKNMCLFGKNISSPTVVDFGSGSGNLALPLAWWFPQCHFVLVDYKLRPLQIAQRRAQDAGLTNVDTWQGRIEHYRPPPTFKVTQCYLE